MPAITPLLREVEGEDIAVVIDEGKYIKDAVDAVVEDANEDGNEDFVFNLDDGGT